MITTGLDRTDEVYANVHSFRMMLVRLETIGSREPSDAVDLAAPHPTAPPGR